MTETTIRELVTSPETVRVMGQTFQLRAVRGRPLRKGSPPVFNVYIEAFGQKRRIRGGVSGSRTVGDLVARFNEIHAGSKPKIELL